MNRLPKEMLPELKIESFVTSLADEKLVNLQDAYPSIADEDCFTPLSWMDLCTNTACSTTDIAPNTGCGC